MYEFNLFQFSLCSYFSSIYIFFVTLCQTLILNFPALKTTISMCSVKIKSNKLKLKYDLVIITMYFILGGTRNFTCIETIWILTIIIFDHIDITATGTVWSPFFDARIQTRVLIF